MTWTIGGREYPALTRQLARQLKAGDYAAITPASSKTDQFGFRWGNKPIWLPYSSTSAINAARALADWELYAGVADDARRDTPLFWGSARGVAPSAARES